MDRVAGRTVKKIVPSLGSLIGHSNTDRNNYAGQISRLATLVAGKFTDALSAATVRWAAVGVHPLLWNPVSRLGLRRERPCGASALSVMLQAQRLQSES